MKINEILKKKRTLSFEIFPPKKDSTNIESIYKTIDELSESSAIVRTNISYLKKLGINNYQEAFLRFYNMFLIEPAAFDDIFSKYDSDDLIEKLEKNIAIMEHL